VGRRCPVTEARSRTCEDARHERATVATVARGTGDNLNDLHRVEKTSETRIENPDTSREKEHLRESRAIRPPANPHQTRS